MESVIRVLRRKSFGIRLMKVSWIALVASFAFGYGHIYPILSIKMRLVCILSGIFILGGYYYTGYAYEHNNRACAYFGYTVTACGMILLELGTLFIGG